MHFKFQKERKSATNLLYNIHECSRIKFRNMSNTAYKVYHRIIGTFVVKRINTRQRTVAKMLSY